jgi:hypothetical protein
LAGTGFLIAWTLLRLTRSLVAGCVAGMAFVLGGPVVEAAYTLSKPELLQCFFLAASAAVLAGSIGAEASRLSFRAVLPASCFILLAALTKETTGLVLAIAIAWTAMAWAWGRTRKAAIHPYSVHLTRGYTAACGIGLAAYIAAALAASPSVVSGAGPRANFTFTWDKIVANTNVWLDLVVRDWLYILPLALSAGLFLISTRKFARVPMILGALVWMAAWFALYLPYRFTPEYYLLPFSLGAAALTGVLTVGGIEGAKGSTRRGIRWVGAGAAAAVAVALFLLTLPNNLSNAGIQLAVDDANAEMLEAVAEAAPPGGVVLVNIREDTEYLWHVGPLLQTVYGRPDLAAEPYTESGVGSQGGGVLTIVVSPFIENVPYPSVRLGIPEAASRQWEAGLHQELEGRLTLVRESRHNARLLAIDAPRLICLVARPTDYCQRRNAPFDTRRFAAGWRVYTVR